MVNTAPRRECRGCAYQADDVILARLLLDGARILNGGVDVHEVLAGRDPDKGADVLDGASTSSVLLVAGGLERGDGLIQLFGPPGVGVELAAVEGRGVHGGGLLRGLSLLRHLRGARGASRLRDLRTVSNGWGVVLPAGEAGVGRDDAGGRDGREDSSYTHCD